MTLDFTTTFLTQSPDSQILINVMEYLSPDDLAKFFFVCKETNQYAYDKRVWSFFIKKDVSESFPSNFNETFPISSLYPIAKFVQEHALFLYKSQFYDEVKLTCKIEKKISPFKYEKILHGTEFSFWNLSKKIFQVTRNTLQPQPKEDDFAAPFDSFFNSFHTSSQKLKLQGATDNPLTNKAFFLDEGGDIFFLADDGVEPLKHNLRTEKFVQLGSVKDAFLIALSENNLPYFLIPSSFSQDASKHFTGQLIPFSLEKTEPISEFRTIQDQASNTFLILFLSKQGHVFYIQSQTPETDWSCWDEEVEDWDETIQYGLSNENPSEEIATSIGSLNDDPNLEPYFDNFSEDEEFNFLESSSEEIAASIGSLEDIAASIGSLDDDPNLEPYLDNFSEDEEFNFLESSSEETINSDNTPEEEDSRLFFENSFEEVSKEERSDLSDQENIEMESSEEQSETELSEEVPTFRNITFKYVSNEEMVPIETLGQPNEIVIDVDIALNEIPISDVIQIELIGRNTIGFLKNNGELWALPIDSFSEFKFVKIESKYKNGKYFHIFNNEYGQEVIAIQGTLKGKNNLADFNPKSQNPKLSQEKPALNSNEKGYPFCK